MQHVHALLEKFWWISLYLTDDATAKLYMTYDVKFCPIEEHGRTFRRIELSNSVISKIF